METTTTSDVLGPRDGLVFDRATWSLHLGDHCTVVERTGGNRAVLEGYVDLIAQCRGVRPTSTREVRAEDLAGLSAALDLDCTDLRQQIEEALAVDTTHSVGLMIELLQERLGAASPEP